ncbi:MAG: sulfur carrier protein ThiS [Planctomycetota bacterium]|jgi:sulfur carrier protein
MKLTLNGTESESPNGLTVSILSGEEQVKTPEIMSVELNGQILKRSKFEETVLKDGDKIEFLFFAAGGKTM